MFFPFDPINEVVAHFIGYFELSTEDARVRLEYREFSYAGQERAIVEDTPAIAPDVGQTYRLADSTQNIFYTPREWQIVGWGQARAKALAPDDASFAQFSDMHDAAARPGSAHRLPQEHLSEDGELALSTIALINQTIVLDDNDIVIFGDYSEPITFVSGSAEAILGFQAQAQAMTGAVLPHADFSDYGNIADFIIETASRIDHLADAPELQDASVIAAPSGTYVNGVAAEEAPALVDHLPVKLAEIVTGEQPAADQLEEEPQHSASESIAFDEVAPSLTLNAGGNLLMNEISIVNAGMGTSVLAVQGNYHQLDAIIQINLYSDHDTVLGAPDSLVFGGASTAAYNVASFETETRDSLGKAAEIHPGGFPVGWNVTVVSGDLFFVEWMKQYIFQSDQDIHVLSAAGTNTIVTTGENVGLNSINFRDIGQYYDLVITGGNFYDANIIVQTNILYDNDTIEFLGAGHSGANQLASQGNLLWNQASILNVGPTEFSAQMPEHISAAATSLAAGGRDMPAGFGQDGVFEGLGALRVLYVAGDVYDMRFLQQTNVLGDADLVKLQQAKLLGENPATDWDINTGANALINKATIIDVDGIGNTAYVAGNHYSDSILIQANILASDPVANMGGALVPEVIAFLDHDIPLGLADDGPFSSATISSDGPPVDIMQTLLT